MAKETRKKVITKKHLARLEREQRQTRLIIISSIAVVLLVIGSIGFGFFEQRVLQPLQPVAEVNGEKITTRYFQERARYVRYNLVNRANQINQLIQMLGDNPDFVQLYQNELQQTLSQLEPTYLGQQLLDTLINEALIRQEAKKRGIAVNAEEIDRALQEDFGYYAEGTPTPFATPPLETPPTFSPTQLALISLTPTWTPRPTATSTPTPEDTPTATPGATLTSTAVPSPTSTIGPTTTATPYTFEAYQSDLKQQFDAIQQSIGFKEEDIRALVEVDLLRKKLLDVIITDLSPEQEEVWARHIMVSTEDAAKQVLDRLANGEDFGALATELSTDTNTQSQGGDLKWLRRDEMEDRFGKAFTEAAFSLGIGETSQIVESESGWHIIQVIGHEIRTMTQTDFESFKQSKFQDWLDQMHQASTIKTYEYWMERVPTEPSFSTSSVQ
jgi:parvulin-like peptidyl-prolyl isomerase